MAGKMRAALFLVALISVTAALQGCREDEQDRVLYHEPGVYQGEPDRGLAEERVEELRQRAQRQQF